MTNFETLRHNLQQCRTMVNSDAAFSNAQAVQRSLIGLLTDILSNLAETREDLTSSIQLALAEILKGTMHLEYKHAADAAENRENAIRHLRQLGAEIDRRTSAIDANERQHGLTRAQGEVLNGLSFQIQSSSNAVNENSKKILDCQRQLDEYRRLGPLAPYVLIMEQQRILASLQASMQEYYAQMNDIQQNMHKASIAMQLIVHCGEHVWRTNDWISGISSFANAFTIEASNEETAALSQFGSAKARLTAFRNEKIMGSDH